MTRTQTAAVSLVAAIPAGFLAALLVMAFLNHAENLRMMTQILVGGTLLVTAMVVLMPFGILIFGGKKSAAKAPAGKKAGKAAGAGSDAEMSSDEYADPEAAEETETVVFSGDESEYLQDADESDYLDTDDLGDDDMLLSDDEILIDDEDEPTAKKKKKKK